MKNTLFFLLILPTFALAQSNTDLLFIKKINEFRKQNGLGELKYDAVLDSAAEWHSAQMAKTGVCSHSEEVYSTPGSRVQKYDPKALGSRFDQYELRENAAKGTVFSNAITDQQIVDEAFTLWLNSPPHRAAMLNAVAKYVGFGDQIVTYEKQPFPTKFNDVWATAVFATDPIVRVE